MGTMTAENRALSDASYADSASLASVEAAFDVIAIRHESDPMSVRATDETGATTAPITGPSSEREGDDLVAVTIPELMSAEERLAHQARLGELRPADACRLAAVTAELDRRWSDARLNQNLEDVR